MLKKGRFVNLSLSILIGVCSIVIFAALIGYSTGYFDLTSEPVVNAEENTSGVPKVPASENSAIEGKQLEKLIFERVNDRRAREGKDPLVHSERVRLIARIHSKDMADRGFFNHTNPDGNGSHGRHQKYDGCEITNENIAKWENLPTDNLTKIATVIVDGWTNSSGHRASMMTTYDKVSGVGVYVTENRTLYVTQNFCREHPNA